LPPTNVYAEVWDEEVSVYWTAPEVTELGVPYYEGFEEGGLLDLWLVDGGDNWVYDDATGNPAPSMRFKIMTKAYMHLQFLLESSRM